MPALPSVVTSYLTAIKNSLKQGTDLGSNVRGAALNYLRAQDMATVLDLLQDGMDQTTNLTAVAGSSARSVRDGVGSFVSGQLIGDIVIFNGNVTGALTGVEARIVDNSDRELFFASNLPATPASGDTYKLRGASMDKHILALRGAGKVKGDAPAGSVYADFRIVADALQTMIEKLSRVRATGTLTLSGNAGNTQTVTIGAKTYTFQTTLTNVDGNVLIGATASDSIDNLIAGIMLGSGSGTLYAAATTLHPTATATQGAGDTMTTFAKVSGPSGNSIATTETLASGAWGAATLLGGAFAEVRKPVLASRTTGTGSTTTVVALGLAGGTLVPDQLRGMEVTIAGETRLIESSTAAGVVTLTAPLTGAPGGGVAYTVSFPVASTSTTAVTRVFSGAQPFRNLTLSDTIDQVQTAVAAFVLPT